MINNEIKQRVKSILENDKDARDCDRLLISKIWIADSNFFSKHLEASDIFEMLVNGTLTSTETIRRCRQRLQEENESLRGLKYRERQRLGEEVRQTISK